jgi:type IV fimbrial biogenesis protein FimT
MVMAATVPRSRGITLIELMVVVAVLAVLVSLAGPPMGQLIANLRIRSTASDLHLALMKARSEALKTNKDASVRPVTGNDWDSGWRVIADINGTVTTIDVVNPKPGVRINPNTPVTSVDFRYDGRSGVANSPYFTISSSGTDRVRCVAVDSTGRPYVKDTERC